MLLPPGHESGNKVVFGRFGGQTFLSMVADPFLQMYLDHLRTVLKSSGGFMIFDVSSADTTIWAVPVSRCAYIGTFAGTNFHLHIFVNLETRSFLESLSSKSFNYNKDIFLATRKNIFFERSQRHHVMFPSFS